MTAVKYVAELSHVREVSLLGAADLSFWSAHLRDAALRPAEKDGRARILIVGADSKYLGVRFREVSFSVLVDLEGDAESQDAAYLIQACNSCSFFAFCERVLFSTPYTHGDVRVSAKFPPGIELIREGKTEIRASLGGHDRTPAWTGDDGWAGPIFLPASRRATPAGGRLYFARLHGRTCKYPFDPARDTVVIRPSSSTDVFAALVESQFAGVEWAVREDATHARSKTSPRRDT